MTQTQNEEAGFTLVELLVSLSLLSLMAIYALNAFNVTSHMKAIALDVEGQSEASAVMRKFQNEVTSLAPAYVRASDGQMILLFEGRHDSVTYVASADGTREVGGLYRVTWRVDDDHQLVVQRTLLGVDANAIVPLVVLQDVAGMTLSFDGSDSWLQRTALPKSISMSLTKTAGKPGKSETIAAIASGF